MKRARRAAVLLVSVLVTTVSMGQNGSTQEPEETPEQGKAETGKPEATAGTLAKAVQNPVSSLISVPVQNNNNFGIGPFDRTQNVLNIQPVVPIRASANWNLIIRGIVPLIWQPAQEQPILKCSVSRKTHLHTWLPYLFKKTQPFLDSET